MPETIGQLVDALRQKCMEDLGVEVEVQLRTFFAPNHETAEKVAILMAQEIGGEMSSVKHDSKKPWSWYNVDGRGVDFAVFWDEKENTAEAV